MTASCNVTAMRLQRLGCMTAMQSLSLKRLQLAVIAVCSEDFDRMRDLLLPTTNYHLGGVL
jgi:hypothetical protein